MADDKGRRLQSRVKDLVGQLLQKVKDPRVGFVTVTDVRMSADDEVATVYYTVLPDTPEEREKTAAGLESASGVIRRDLGKALQVRKTPEVVFAIDDVADSGRRIEAILDDLHGRGSRDVDPDAVDPG